MSRVSTLKGWRPNLASWAGTETSINGRGRTADGQPSYLPLDRVESWKWEIQGIHVYGEDAEPRHKCHRHLSKICLGLLILGRSEASPDWRHNYTSFHVVH